MLAVQPWSGGDGDEELGAVGVGSSIGHGECSRSTVLDLEVLVFKLGAVDGLTSGAVSVGEVTALEHELRYNSVEDGALEPEAPLAGAEGSEVFGSLGHDGIVELHNDSSDGLASNFHVEVDMGVAWVAWLDHMLK